MAACACCTPTVVVICSKGPSLSPCPKKSKQQVPIPWLISDRVRVLFVELVFEDKKPWHKTAILSVPPGGRVAIAATRCP